MPGRGPAPKKPEDRVNRHKPDRGEWQTLPAGRYDGPKPHLPRLAGGLTKSTKDTWSIWWTSPMAHMWASADWPALVRLITMTDRVTRALNRGEFFAGFASMNTEIRQLEDRFGLSEKGRRDLRWALPGDGEEATDVPDELAARRTRRPKAVDPDAVERPK